MPVFTVDVGGDDKNDRTALHYEADRPPEVGETIEADGLTVVVENVLLSSDPDRDDARIEARRSKPSE